MSLEPYYDHGGVTIYHADCREVLPRLGPVDAVLTDPVWPNGTKELPGSDDPERLLAEALYRVDARRVVVHLGCLSDPRVLTAVPRKWPFFRVCWLRFSFASHRGRALVGSDVAYAFGEPPAPRRRNITISGECPGDREKMLSKEEKLRKYGHPTPRKLAHVRWLVWKMTNEGELVVDPFAGSGTTLVACREHGRRVIGIDVSERSCEVMAERLSQEPLGFGQDWGREVVGRDAAATRD